MANALDYIKWRGDLDFGVAPINEIDIFLLTQIVMADFGDIVSNDDTDISLHDVAKKYFETHDTDVKNLGVLQSEHTLPAFHAMSKAKRYKKLMLTNYVNRVCEENDEQFSATTFRFSPEVMAVVFRGTDDTIIGWKEDCNMAIYDEVPAQRDAVKYLERMAESFSGKFIIAGHSKGGNLAVFAASKSKKEVRDRVIQVFNFDGPGFSEKFLSKSKGYDEMKDRIITVVSQNSIIGMLLNVPGRMVCIKSNAEGFYAHDGFSWETDVNHFLRVRSLSKSSMAFDNAFTKIMDKYGVEERKAFVEELFNIIYDTGADTLLEFKSLGWKVSWSTVGKITKNKAIRDFVNSFFVAMLGKSYEQSL